MMKMPTQINRAVERILELETILAHPVSQQERVDALLELGWELRMSQPGQAKALGQKAHELSQTGDFSSNPYHRGLGGSLVIQAFVETYAGELGAAVVKCLQALDLFKQELEIQAINAWYTLSWTNFFLGDYPLAIDHAIKALRLSRETGSRLAEAWALDAIASIHGASGNFVLALEVHRGAVEVFDSLNEVQGKIWALNNLAHTLHLMKQDSTALEYARQGLEIARQWSLMNETFTLCTTLAQILIDTGELEQAEDYLRESLSAWTIFGDTNLSQVHVMLEWGRLCLLKNDDQTARAYFQKALAQAETIGQPTEQALCHQRLSELYEKQGLFEKALTEYKAFHTLWEFVTGERTNQRLAASQGAYQAESTRYGEEIYRLQTIQLQREVENQKRIQDNLEHLTRIDGLTGIANRRYFDEKLAQEYARLARSGAELSLIMLDVDHFKIFNDTYGHVGGDDCLKKIAQVLKGAAVRPADLAARYGGEEFAFILPDTSSLGARKVAEKIQEGVRTLAIPHRRSSTASHVTVSMGVVTTRCVPGGTASEVIVHADQQLYGAKAGGRNRIQAVVLSASGLLVEQEEGNLVRLIWNNSFCSGHPLIDAQHQELFTLTNELFDIILSTNLPDEVFPVISRLFEYLKEHFQAEEKILEEVGYQAVQKHASEHALLINKGNEIIAEFKTGNLPVGKVFHYLTYEVTARHILTSDRKFFPLFGVSTI
jgi:diguanylate cyclase (GGDEF)-like protein/hemerythrin-like metal-binding protein